MGDDLREGKPNLSLIYLMEHGTPEQRALVRNYIEHGDETHFDEILLVITSSGALDYTMQEARKAAQRARDHLAGLPDSQFKSALLNLCTFAVDRNP